MILLIVLWSSFHGHSITNSQAENKTGIKPLLELKGKSLHALIPSDIQPLILRNEIETFLKKLDETPPAWTQLEDADITEQSERLFQFNRQRNAKRSIQDTFEQPIAFLWTGILRQYLDEFKGFSLALGPELINTSWGIVRFKPINLPPYLIAIPTLALRKNLLARQKQGETIEVNMVCMGTLISDESLIYGFSHDDHHNGMILPVVSVQNLMYILKPS